MRAVCRAVVAALAVLAFSARARKRGRTGGANGVEHLNFAAGPYHVIPGANLILDQYNNVPKPHVNGFMIRMEPNLVYALPNGKCCGKVPPTDIVHLHHGVWLSNGASGQGEGENGAYGPLYPFMAAGEEKTTIRVPARVRLPDRRQRHVDPQLHDPQPHRQATDRLHHLRHGLRPGDLAAGLVDNAGASDLDGRRGPPHLSGVQRSPRAAARTARFTFPDMAKNPYGGGAPLNEFTVDHPGTLIGTAGHLHPGGLYDDLNLTRPGVRPAPGAIPGSAPGSVRLFRSNAVYWDKGRQPVSWDVSMTATPADWRPQVQSGRRPERQRDLRLEARLLVRGDGDHGRVGGVGRPERHEPLHVTSSTRRGTSPTATCPRTTTTAARNSSASTPPRCRRAMRTRS